MKTSIFWDLNLCSSLKVNRRSLVHAHFLLGLFFDPEEEGAIVLETSLVFR
jgi:hypothetical protein